MENDQRIAMELENIAKNSVLLTENIAVSSIAEISRRTGMQPLQVLTSINRGGIVVNQKLAIIENNEQVLKIQPSKKRDRSTSIVRKETQRYQRRFQFPDNAKSRTTRAKAEKLTRSMQIKKAKIILTQQEPTQTKPIDLKKQARFYISNTSTESETKLVQSESRKLMQIWESRSVASPERPDRIRSIVGDSIKTQQPANIVNWICPAGSKLDFSPTGDTFQRYVGVSMEIAFANDHRLYPRLGLEKQLIRSFRRIDNLPQPLYLKIMADDNPLCLSPYGVQLDGQKPTMQAIADYSIYVQNQLNMLVGQDEIAVSTFSSLLGPRMFQEFVYTFKKTSFDDIAPYLPPDAIQNELRIAQLHMKVGPEILSRLDEYVKKVLRQYAVEGLYLYKLFEDDVIMAWNESTTRSQTMDSLRKKMGLPTIPKIFVLHEQRNGEILDNA